MAWTSSASSPRGTSRPAHTWVYWQSMSTSRLRGRVGGGSVMVQQPGNGAVLRCCSAAEAQCREGEGLSLGEGGGGVGVVGDVVGLYQSVHRRLDPLLPPKGMGEGGGVRVQKGREREGGLTRGSGVRASWALSPGRPPGSRGPQTRPGRPTPRAGRACRAAGCCRTCFPRGQCREDTPGQSQHTGQLFLYRSEVAVAAFRASAPFWGCCR